MQSFDDNAIIIIIWNFLSETTGLLSCGCARLGEPFSDCVHPALSETCWVLQVVGTVGLEGRGRKEERERGEREESVRSGEDGKNRVKQVS